jgi:hypothetical protein
MMKSTKVQSLGVNEVVMCMSSMHGQDSVMDGVGQATWLLLAVSKQHKNSEQRCTRFLSYEDTTYVRCAECENHWLESAIDLSIIIGFTPYVTLKHNGFKKILY